MNREKFIESLTKINVDCNEDILKKLDTYIDYLLEYNSHTNLTAITDINDIYLKHFYDSLSITKVIDLKNSHSLIDLGSGAGFPGMVLKIFYPHLNVVLLDSNHKKTDFLKKLVDKLGLSNITIINDRVEHYAQDNLNKFDVVTARAVTNLPVLAELALPLVKEHGYFVAMKGNLDEELQKAIDPIEIMGGKIITKEVFNLEDAGVRTLIKIEKIRLTNIKELRPYEKIIKKPLQKKGK